jgi:phosphatidylethanolamine/phosphatidyl-N-methylethanolamine N-methyltransferase
MAFFKHFIKSPHQVGSIWPSSQKLAVAMVKGIDWRKDFVVELGCGTGALTQEIVKHLECQEHYLGFELQPDLQRRLTTRFPGLNIVAASATELHSHLKPNAPPIHAVLSSLPFTTIDREVTQVVIEEYAEALAPGGLFRMFLYAHTADLPKNRRFLEFVAQHLEPEGRELVLWNLPPAYVFTFRKTS